ncbi:FimB/Mfa2 family fimbrial subunit [Mucilaginibacter sp.]|uniref:FimB/Mfa2 family fimbrial subunit n=1 Tax=Mucilaginibacter sp. TaxID=1882438 RepID=UPI0025ED6376|nr:FimB/Mfa2 family fimbrial subunit [Mucilaginibacter sp.]
MKKAILLLLMAPVIFFSCKKDHNKTPVRDTKTYNVNLNIDGATSEVTNSSGGKIHVNGLQPDSVPISSYLKMLYYHIFDSNGTEINHIVQDSTAANFGVISDNLPAGTYRVIITAGMRNLVAIVRDDGVVGTADDNLTAFQKTKAYYDPKLPVGTQPQLGIWDDTFSSTFPITVSASGVNQQVLLNRIVGQLEIKLLDQIPANAAKIYIEIESDEFFYNLNTNLPEGPTKETMLDVIPTAAKGHANYKIDRIIGNTTTPFKVTIFCLDAGLNPLGLVTVDNVICQKNKRTVLSGNLFSGNSGITITLEPLNPTIITVPFF